MNRAAFFNMTDIESSNMSGSQLNMAFFFFTLITVKITPSCDSVVRYAFGQQQLMCLISAKQLVFAFVTPAQANYSEQLRDESTLKLIVNCLFQGDFERSSGKST